MFCVVQTGAVWLRSWCARAAGENSSQGDGTVALAVANIIMTAKGDNEAVAQLFDLFGESALDAIQEISSIRYVERQ